MKILQLCKKFPFPIKDGEAIAITNLARALQQLGCELTLLCMNTPKHYFDPEDLPAHFNYYQAIHTIDVDTNLRASAALANLFSTQSYHIVRFVSPAFEKKLIDLLNTQSFDVIQMETLYLAPYSPVIRQHSEAKIAMRAHNVEYEIWQRIAQNTVFLPKKWYLNYLTGKLRHFEQSALVHYDLLVPITQRDLQHFQQMGSQQKALTTPIGIDAARYQPHAQSFQHALSLSFIGSLDWMPNQEGLQWFLREVWPALHQRYPNLSLHVAGRNPPDWMLQMERENIVVHGEVPSAPDFINQHSLMIVPLLSGSGMRVKILEGMALGKVVLTTSVGLEGIDAQHQQEVLIADCVEEWLACFDFCLHNEDRLPIIGRQARQLIEQRYDNQRIAQKLLKAYHQL
ncbi:MAG: glycosyltransferase family 4 protein [Bacteroidota bacterium]